MNHMNRRHTGTLLIWKLTEAEWRHEADQEHDGQDEGRGRDTTADLFVYLLRRSVNSAHLPQVNGEEEVEG
ncbi:hypothetical protein PIB30_073510 [Stylosanthes scabra]|uniref:Uncharacterized protein n=1 Tax=Stylosanthes scabra TaxID=79078 RepID=A0ABU6WSG0_9FABA|nr:hypothetical protein [Stylosanthes scabra]